MIFKRINRLQYWLGIVSLCLFVLLLGFVGLAYQQAYHLVHHPKADREAPEQLMQDFNISGREVVVTNPQGQSLYGHFAATNNGAYVMLQHGYKADISDLFEEAEILQQAGFGILLTSVRAHGKNDGKQISFGRSEMADLQSWYDYLLKAGATPGKVGILGNSLGASMAIEYATLNADIGAVVSVSGFSSLQDTINVSVEYYTGLPAFPFAPMIAFWAEKITGMKVEDISAVKAITKLCHTPVFIMQGGADKVISVASGQWLHDAACGPTEFWFEPEVEHIKFDRDMSAEFSQRVVTFFNKYLIDGSALKITRFQWQLIRSYKMNTTSHGSCLCGQVTFQINGPLRKVLLCHCQQCRKTSGHYWAATNVLKTHLVMLKEQGLKWFASSDKAKRGFCQGCGASLFWSWHDSDTISIAAGSLDGDTGLQVEAHIFTGYKGDYYHLPKEEFVRPLDQDHEVKSLHHG